MSSWQHTDIIIAPSLLAADFSRIQEETQRAINSGGDWIHLDVMDGHFVDNISFGPAIIKAIANTTLGEGRHRPRKSATDQTKGVTVPALIQIEVISAPPNQISILKEAIETAREKEKGREGEREGGEG